MMSRSSDVIYEPFREVHLEGVVALCRELSWRSYLDPATTKPIYGQQWYPSFATDQWGSFWTGEADDIPFVESGEHFGRIGIGPEDTVFTLPSDIETHLHLCQSKHVNR